MRTIAIKHILEDAEYAAKIYPIYTGGFQWADNYHRDVTYLLELLERLVPPDILANEEDGIEEIEMRDHQLKQSV